MILWRRLSGSSQRIDPYPAVSRLAVGLTLACLLVLPLRNGLTCFGPRFVLVHYSTWRDITSLILRRDGQTNMGHQKIKTTFNLYWPIRPTTASWRTSLIRQCCSSRETQTLDAIRCTHASWRRACK